MTINLACVFEHAIGYIKAFPKLFSTQYASCGYCHSSIGSGNSLLNLCEKCRVTIPWIKNVICLVCGRYESCTDCKRRRTTHYVMNRSAVQYSNEMRELLARYKYRGDESLLTLLIEMLRFPYESLEHSLLASRDRFTCITYIPLSPERLAERGFNQAEQLAQGIGKLYGIPVVPLLKRVLHTGKQSYKTREQRLNDLEHAFMYSKPDLAFSKINQADISLFNILIIDDVYTTGSTLNQCASVIRQHLNARIYGLTWAR